ncbi:MAG: EcsC family protein [Deltaproteobacteria bacterium]|nr:EcsC family protein [Deltaproteobacteria bacterium]MBW2035563.1 EcsC family protein [Deltaproteobacteria bacterium]
MPMSQNELEDLKYAKELLENPGLAARITDALGTAIDKGFELLPAKWSDVVQQTTKESLRKALEFAVMTMDNRPRVSSWSFLHKMFAATSGAVGGSFGLPALTVELPVSTIIMLRSIADIARSEGEKIKTLEAKLACLEVFALGGKSPGDDSTETGYFVIRAAFAREISEVAKYISKKGLAKEGAPAIARFITKIASRFGVNVSEKIAAQAVPLIGAAGGALINTIFIDHFQDMARGHFIIRRLERVYGTDEVKCQYEKL